MKKLATLALAVAALSLTFNFTSCSGGSGSSSDSGSYDSESEETTSGSSSGTSSTGSGSGSGSGSTGSGSGNTSTGSGTVSGAALPAGSIQLLSYSSSDLNNKVFSYEDEEDGTTRYLGFSGGKCYKSSNPNSFNKQKDYDIIKYNGKLYSGWFIPRTSGSGLFATFSAEDEDGQISLTFNNSGSIAVSENGRHTGDFTFTNTNGELLVTIPGEGNNKWCYDGSKIYSIKERLTYYGSFPR
ncbi:MAG: hypothetical protein J6Y30_02275 [Treponema sp.]|nr:hypothetical protein [Treponema sp.]